VEKKNGCSAWEGDSHRALADTLACRAVWNYLENESATG